MSIKHNDIPIKNQHEKCRSDRFWQLEDTPPSPQLIARFPPLIVSDGSGENDAIVMGEMTKSMDTARIIGSWRREVDIPTCS
jgi:hypothetical protein